jgi:hypothetical protein
VSVQYGTPLFTSGVFGNTSAQDDLGVEEVGPGILRRLIPGVIQNTPSAGYHAFYPYLLWKREQEDVTSAVTRSKRSTGGMKRPTRSRAPCTSTTTAGR